jgi:hypothetical protein
MTKLEQAIDKVKSLPEATQDQLADWLLSFADNQPIFIFTPEESAELDRRLANLKVTRSIEEVFATL